MALDGRMLRRLVDGLAGLYEPTGTDGYPARVVAVVMRLLPVDSCSYNEFGPPQGAARGSGPGGVGYLVEPAGVGDFPGASRLFLQHLPEHPVLAHQQATGDGRARRISDFLSRRQFRALGLYTDFYRHAEVEYQAAITLPAPGGGLIGVALNRQRADFGDDEIELLDLLRPHVGRAARTAALLGQPLPGQPLLRQPPPVGRRAAGDRPVLTPRQTRILALVADGHSDRSIARLLHISTRTVHAHLQHIYRSLDVASRTEALARVRSLSPGPASAGGSPLPGPGPRPAIVGVPAPVAAGPAEYS